MGTKAKDMLKAIEGLNSNLTVWFKKVSEALEFIEVGLVPGGWNYNKPKLDKKTGEFKVVIWDFFRQMRSEQDRIRRDIKIYNGRTL